MQKIMRDGTETAPTILEPGTEIQEVEKALADLNTLAVRLASGNRQYMVRRDPVGHQGATKKKKPSPRRKKAARKRAKASRARTRRG
jgi:hypothetical protein